MELYHYTFFPFCILKGYYDDKISTLASPMTAESTEIFLNKQESAAMSGMSSLSAMCTSSHGTSI